MNKVEIGPGFATLLTILFIALKLTHVIAWSWIWVLAPLWIGFVVSCLTLVIFLFIALLVAWLEGR